MAQKQLADSVLISALIRVSKNPNTRIEIQKAKIMQPLKISDENYNLLETVVLEIGRLEKSKSGNLKQLCHAFELVAQCEDSQNQKGFDLALANLRTIFTKLTRSKLG
jgi:hypothetical protein